MSAARAGRCRSLDLHVPKILVPRSKDVLYLPGAHYLKHGYGRVDGKIASHAHRAGEQQGQRCVGPLGEDGFM